MTATTSSPLAPPPLASASSAPVLAGSPVTASGRSEFPSEFSEEVRVKIRRIHRLSEKLNNPSFASQHLEHIRALSVAVLEALGETPETELQSLAKSAYADAPMEFGSRQNITQPE